jgi:DNA-binding FadR family transcriptional regulator
MSEVIAKVESDDLEDLTAINERLKNTSAVVTLAEIDLTFHKRLLAVAGNDTALKVYEVLSGVILQIMTLGKAQNGSELAYGSHKAIIAALAARNADELDARLAEHMELGQRYLANRSGGVRP